MGGSGGTSVITAAMRALPTGVPKVCVSTVAGGDVAPYVGTKDITLIPSVADVAGVNRISRIIFTRAAGAIVGMVRASAARRRSRSADHRRQHVRQHDRSASTPAARCSKRPATKCSCFTPPASAAARWSRSSTKDSIDACLDITTTEWADELCGGVFTAGRRSPRPPPAAAAFRT